MIPTSTLSGESYELTPTPSGEIRLVTSDKRGSTLALALGGRMSLRPRAYYFTPARAEKWQTLFTAGFTARRRRLFGATVWGFAREGGLLRLADAVKAARNSLHHPECTR